MRALKIQKIKDSPELEITFDDGISLRYPLSFLRDKCPCAGCQGEILFGKVYKPAPLSIFQEGMYELASLSPVGQYAVQALWKDGHDTGIYSWEYLRMLAEELQTQ